MFFDKPKLWIEKQMVTLGGGYRVIMSGHGKYRYGTVRDTFEQAKDEANSLNFLFELLGVTVQCKNDFSE